MNDGYLELLLDSERAPDVLVYVRSISQVLDGDPIGAARGERLHNYFYLLRNVSKSISTLSVRTSLVHLRLTPFRTNIWFDTSTH